jgi:hypothetical protein
MMKKLFPGVLAALFIALAAASASAWEFSLSGNFQWGYDYFAQGGRSGFFGTNDAINPAGADPGLPNFRSMNAWVGARTINDTQYGLVTGKDASLNYQRVEFYPEIKINRAIRLKAWYQIGSFKPTTTVFPSPIPPHTYGLYVNSSNPGAWNPIHTGEWTQWWATAETPWGTVVVGKRPLIFGIGAQYDGTNITSESLLCVVPYGPLRLGLGIYPHRRALWVNSFAVPFTDGGLFGDGTYGTGGISRQFISTFDGGTYTKQWDHDSAMIQQPFVFITYRSGVWDIGILYEWLKEHEGPQSGHYNGDVAAQVTRDSTVEDGCVYVKYNNGRYFLNSELAWSRVQTNFQLPLTFTYKGGALSPVDPGDGGGSQYAPYSNEAWKFMTELGTIFGPAKISLLYSWVPGPDRRHGIWINKQSWENIQNGQYLGNAQAFLPYSLLMGYQYGAGLNAVNWNGEGYMTDASSWGARLDYAVASNLNVYASFFYATRVSKGWGWGSLVPTWNGNVALFGTGGAGPLTTGGPNTATGVPGVAALQNLITNGAPSIPDDSLGWEVTAGADWKLLEGLTLRARWAYWQPGRWFKYACVDKTLVTDFYNSVVPLPQQSDGAGIGSSWGVNPNRSIDPITGFQSYLVYDF